MNNVSFLLLLLLVLSSCNRKRTTEFQQAAITKSSPTDVQINSDTLRLDMSRSIIHWKGTKMKGLGKHEGQIELEDGFFTITNNLLTGGHFIANMNSIEVTDIPAHEPVPRGRFNDHMKSEDFFDTATYPVSKFEITGIQYKTTNSLIISGNLTLKDITRNISFAANYKEKTFETGFTIDRFQWNIGYEGSWVDKTLVDKDIVLEIQLFTE